MKYMMRKTSRATRKSLNNIKKNRLEAMLSERGVNYQNGAPKETLQKLLFEKILGSAAAEKKPSSKRKDERCVWKKGAWLSLMTNYRSQIQTHGNVRFLW